MTDLTEQWKKGKLDIDECYFAETEGGIYKTTGEYLNSSSCIHGFDITTILEPVPSYDEWKNFVDANTSLFDAVKMLEKDNFRLEKQNAELKELLKECRPFIQIGFIQSAEEEATRLILLNKIDEVQNE